MPAIWSTRLLTLLQLTRMALVFTAIADAWCALALWEAWRRPPGTAVADLLDPWRLLTAAGVSVGLYGFGMSLNDLIDRRRDEQISPGRPLPSGRVSVGSATLVCGLLLALAVGSAALFRMGGGPAPALAVTCVTLGLIWFYDAAGKYLVGPGLVTLGLVRFAQALVPALEVHPSAPPAAWHPLLWHPLWLLNHVAILSAVCYGWEQKRPALTARHWVGVVVALLAIDGTAAWWIGTRGHGSVADNLQLDRRLAGPVVATLAFAVVALRVKRRAPTSREAGQAAMLYGLLWLILYDAVFAGLYAHPAIGVGLFLLLPLAYASVRVMRAWSKLVAASQRPDFKRAGV